MATQKVGLTKLGLKKNTNFIPIEWNDQIVEVKEYLPIKDKIEVIDNIFNISINHESNVVNIIQLDINIILEIVFAYTNINFTEKQKENRLDLYDLLISSGLWNKIFEVLDNTPTKEFEMIHSTAIKMINEFYKYKDSILGIIDSVNKDYNDVDLNMDNIQEKLTDLDNLPLLKDIITKLG